MTQPTFGWGAIGTVGHLLTTELNSLADGSGSAYGPEIDWTAVSPKPLWCELALLIASSSSAFTSASYVLVFLVPPDGAGNYPTYTSGSSYKLAEANYLAASIQLNPTTQSSNIVYENVTRVPVPAGGKFKTILVSHAAVTLPASGNTLDAYPTPVVAPTV